MASRGLDVIERLERAKRRALVHRSPQRRPLFVRQAIQVLSLGVVIVIGLQFAHWVDSRRFLLLHSNKGQVFLVDKAWFGGDHAAMNRFTAALDRREAPPADGGAAAESSPPGDAEKA